MTPIDAIIAPYVKRQECEFRQYRFVSIFATNRGMDTIDRDWIKERLDKMPRGSQARLARHMGIQTNTLSKIMSGKRTLQQDEIPKVLTFFNARIVTEEEVGKDLQTVISKASRLNSDGLRLLQNQLNEMLRTPSLVLPAESSPLDGTPGVEEGSE